MDDTPKPKQRKYVISPKINEVLESHFSGELSLLQESKLSELYNEGIIDLATKKECSRLRKLYEKSEKGEITLQVTYQPEKLVLDKSVRDILRKYFDGDIKNIRATRLNQLVKDKTIQPSQKKQLMELKKSSNKRNADDLIQYVPSEEKPEADEPEPQEEDEEAEPDEPEPEEAEPEEADEPEEAEEYSPDSPRYDESGQPIPYDDVTTGKYLDIKQSQYIVPHRKAFVKFINDGFYKKVLKETKDSELNVYQILVREYLSIETPYRGLLVYHGLGTGKTATAVTMAESLSDDMKIRTLLPASLESNFVGEVKRWGQKELDIQGQQWSFTPLSDIQSNTAFRKKIFKQFSIGEDQLKEIFNHTIREVKKKISFTLLEAEPELQEDIPELKKRIQQKYKEVSPKIKQTQGFWMYGGDKTYDSLEAYEKLALECQIHKLVQLKYNFIHYNPLPPIKRSEAKEIAESVDEEDLFDENEVRKHTNEAIKQDLIKQMRRNIKKHDVESPFYQETLIIDEVHNFVREILNNSGSARTFYEWILNAEKVKLVFLSGTPIINKPCEIAILYNMLRGKQKIYRFTVQSSEDPVSVTSQLNAILYKDHSPIELFHVSRSQGRLIVSFTKHSENFVSLMNPENQVVYTSTEHSYSYEQFINEIFKGLSKVFPDATILPSKQEALQASLETTQVFDRVTETPYFTKQNLFEIKDNEQELDLTDNETFMDYFFRESYDVPPKKRVLLRRMLMGLTSYYPIDRSKIGTMPSITTPKLSPGYENYTIAKNITIEPCVMSHTQFSKYIEVWRNEKKKDLMRQMRRHLHEEIPFDFNIRTRQICNMIYKDDEFRYIRDKDRAYSQKLQQYEQLKSNRSLALDHQLDEYSPKLFKMMTNIQLFVTQKIGTGKVLIYSDFRGDSGGEILEQMLMANGYSRFDPTNPPTQSLKYTFITGEESVETRKQNMEAYNHPDNKYGSQIQVMIISGAGAEGISLTCVRQVHILEPFWNFVRIDQVFGRAIRLHSHDDLEPKQRTVEEYLYLSVLPTGASIEEIYTSIRQWTSVPKLGNVKQDLAKEQHKDIKELIEMIINIGQTIDQKIFEMMERKYKVSQNMIDIIKESSLDCIQHTRDEPRLNDRCIRFSNQLLHEIAYFPGISASELFEIDQTQLKATFLKYIRPNHCVVAGDGNEYIYYEVDSKPEEDMTELDIRYLRENSKKICVVSLQDMVIYVYADKDHSLTEELGKQFSVYQDMISLEPFYEDIIQSEPTFPTVTRILNKQRMGYKIKYNVNEMMFYSPNETKKLRRLYRFEDYQSQNLVKALLLVNGDVYLTD